MINFKQFNNFKINNLSLINEKIFLNFNFFENIEQIQIEINFLILKDLDEIIEIYQFLNFNNLFNFFLNQNQINLLINFLSKISFNEEIINYCINQINFVIFLKKFENLIDYILINENFLIFLGNFINLNELFYKKICEINLIFKILEIKINDYSFIEKKIWLFSIFIFKKSPISNQLIQELLNYLYISYPSIIIESLKGIIYSLNWNNFFFELINEENDFFKFLILFFNELNYKIQKYISLLFSKLTLRIKFQNKDLLINILNCIKNSNGKIINLCFLILIRNFPKFYPLNFEENILSIFLQKDYYSKICFLDFLIFYLDQDIIKIFNLNYLNFFFDLFLCNFNSQIKIIKFLGYFLYHNLFIQEIQNFYNLNNEIFKIILNNYNINDFYIYYFLDNID